MDAGRVAVLASGFEPADSDLAYRPALVPLLHNTLTWVCAARLGLPEAGTRELWPILTAALLVLLVTEAWLARWFSPGAGCAGGSL